MKKKYILPFLLMFSTFAFALSIGDFYKNAEVMKANSVKLVNDSLIKVSTTIKGYGANSPYAIKTVDVPKASFLSHVKTNVRGLVKKNAWYAAWFATMAAAGWAIDELTGQMTRPTIKQTGTCRPGANMTSLPIYAINVTIKQCSDSVVAAANQQYPSFTFYVDSVLKVDNQTFHILGNATVWNPPLLHMATLQDVKTSSEPNPSPVPDDELYDSLAGFMLQDPEAAAQAFMVPDAWPYPYPHIFPDPVKYIPGVTEADEALLDSLIKGQLQTTNPSAPNYVTPEKLQQLQQLLSQLQQGITPEGQVDDLNAQAKAALTQAQLNQSLDAQQKAQQKAAEAEAAAITNTDVKPVTEAYNDSKIQDEFDKLKDIVSDPGSLPSLPDLPSAHSLDLPKYTPCQTVTATFMGQELQFPNASQCQKLEQVKAGLAYLFYILTALGIIFELYRRVE